MYNEETYKMWACLQKYRVCKVEIVGRIDSLVTHHDGGSVLGNYCVNDISVKCLDY